MECINKEHLRARATLCVDQVAFSIHILQASDFKNIESIDTFLSSQERQAIIFHLLNSIRAEKGDAATEKLKFRDGEAICKKWKIVKRNLLKAVYFRI